MPKGTTYAADIQKLVYQAVAIANIADNAASSPLTNIQVGLHTADPAGTDETASEISYTPYARIAVARTTGGWGISSASISPVADISFAQMASGSGGTATHFHTGIAASGTGKIIHSGTVTPNVVVAAGVAARLTTATTIVES